MSSISLKIRILDKEYQVNCTPEERPALEASAQRLNEKMEEVQQGSHIIGLERIAVMAALNLSHDLIRAETNAKQGLNATKLLKSIDLKLNSALTELNGEA